MPSRPDGRAPDALRDFRIDRSFPSSAPGSVLAAAGSTVVLCTASYTDTLPQWLVGSGHGWVTAEYSMLPGSTSTRKAREARTGKTDARALEIQRLIGRSLRAVVDIKALPEVSIWLDCDVLSADGSTRTTAITGAYVALHDVLSHLKSRGRIKQWPIKEGVAACSVGIVKGRPLLDLCYHEDSAAEVDMNVVMTERGEFAEVQASGEGATLSRASMNELLDLAEVGCHRLFDLQRTALEAPGKNA